MLLDDYDYGICQSVLVIKCFRETESFLICEIAQRWLETDQKLEAFWVSIYEELNLGCALLCRKSMKYSMRQGMILEYEPGPISPRQMAL